MSQRMVVISVLLLGLLAIEAQAQNDLNLQIHGFATQSFVYSGANNYLGMGTSSGTFGWTEAAINVNDTVTDKLRIGMQLHYTRLGNFGGETPTVDWALGDYKVNERFGLRAGKVKIRWGLYNNEQDYDPGYLWSLLPESIYGIDFRSTNLSQLGVEAYGKIFMGKRFGSLLYSAYYGDYSYVAGEGETETFKEMGLNFKDPPGGKTPGFDLTWATPLSGLKIGGSLMMFDASGNMTDGAYKQPLAFWPTYYAQYDRRNLFFSFQYVRLVEYQTVTINGSAPSTSDSDTSSWFAMVGYHVTKKLQVGGYYTRYTVAGADKSDPENYFHDWVASSRYDVNAYLYGKLEAHFIDGNAIGFYNFNNPNGIARETNLLVAKLGFVF